jgi:dTDP-4-dehydrorhamnose 3,5-epimerase
VNVNVETTDLPGVLMVAPVLRGDARGSFHESWHLERYANAGLPVGWVQDNVSRSPRGVLRGLHFQHPAAQAKLISVLAGEILDVAADIRRGSPDFGRVLSVRLSSSDGRQLYIPAGFAHGFLVLSDEAIVHYKCTEYYRPDCDRAIAWNDPQLAISWPIDTPTLSPRDATARPLSDFGDDELPTYFAGG